MKAAKPNDPVDSKSDGESSNAPQDEKPERMYKPVAPFPQCLVSTKRPSENQDILEVFQEDKISIPLLDVIKQIPSYAKFLKDLCSMKCKQNVHKKTFFMEQVSTIVQQNTHPKFKDPGSLTISYMIGNFQINRALLDLGASVNLIPYSVYEQFGLGELKPIKITLQLADRSIRIPRGVIEDSWSELEPDSWSL